MSYLWQVLLGLDRLLNALLGGHSRETVSSRIGRSILHNQWASRVPWPRSLYLHFVTNVEVL